MAEPAEIVQRTVTESFGEFLGDGRFALADEYGDGPRTPVLSEGDDACVGWSFSGTHTEDWPGVGPASGRPVTVIGATFVSDLNSGEPKQYSVIDWGAVLAQVGTLSIDRPVELVEPEGDS